MKQLVTAAVALSLIYTPVKAHEIYTGVHGRDGQLCCGADDCFATTYSEKKTHFFFRLKPQDGAIELDIPADRITWLPIPGDDPAAPSNRAHLCYRTATATDLANVNWAPKIIDNQWLIFCAFIPPGGT